MIYKGVDIFLCKWFSICKPSEGRGLKFVKGKYKGKTTNDFNTTEELDKIIAYCFWIIKKDDVPFYSKFAAASFLKELYPKVVDLESQIGVIAIRAQEKLQKETKETIRETGTRYSKR